MKHFLATIYTPQGKRTQDVIARSSCDAFLQIIDSVPEGSRVQVRRVA